MRSKESNLISEASNLGEFLATKQHPPRLSPLIQMYGI